MESVDLKSRQTAQALAWQNSNGVIANEGALESASAELDSKRKLSYERFVNAQKVEQELLLNPYATQEALTTAANNVNTAYMMYQYEVEKSGDGSQRSLLESDGDMSASSESTTQGRRTGVKDIDHLLDMYELSEAARKIVDEAVQKATEYYRTLVEIKRLFELNAKLAPDTKTGEMVVDFNKTYSEFMGKQYNPPKTLGAIMNSMIDNKFAGDAGLLFTTLQTGEIGRQQAQAFADKLGGAIVEKNEEDGTYSVKLDLSSMRQMKDTHDQAKANQGAVGANGRLSAAQYNAMITGLSAAQNNADSVVQKFTNGGSFAQGNHEALVKLVTSIIASNQEMMRAIYGG